MAFALERHHRHEPTMTTEVDLRAALDAKAKPLGSLGRLEDLAVRLGVIQATLRPAVTDPAVLVFAGDHGTPGVSAYPSAVTAAMVGVYLSGRAAINLFARQAGARLLVVDAGVAADLADHPGLIAAKVAMGTADWTAGPAMTGDQVDLALSRAAAIVDALADGGTTVIALGEMGIGNTASAALLSHKVAGLPLLVGRGAGLDDAGLTRKQALVQRGAARAPGPLDGRAALAEFGGFEIAMLVGAILQAARRRVCVVVDGVIVTAAALVARAIDPGCLDVCVFAHRSAEPGHDAMLAALGASPLLDLGLRLGEGTGAALAIPLLRAACAVLGEMADLADVV
jgi:nicotinate-nucleotide--dimethylbenzimidazole phosphoribosyltransferase